MSIQYNRRSALKTLAATPWTLAASSQFTCSAKQPDPLPVAAVITEYRNNSHADVIVGKILEGFKQDGGDGPGLKLAALYVDQFPKNDMSRELSQKHGFPISNTIEEAIRLVMKTGFDSIEIAAMPGYHGAPDQLPSAARRRWPSTATCCANCWGRTSCGNSSIPRRSTTWRRNCRGWCPIGPRVARMVCMTFSGGWAT